MGGWYDHTGGEPGVTSLVDFQPGKKIGLIIFSNKRTKQVNHGNKIYAVIRRIAKSYFKFLK